MLWDASGNDRSRPGSLPAIKPKNHHKCRHHAAILTPPGLARAPHSINIAREDTLSWEIPLPASSPSRVSTCGVGSLKLRL